MIFYTVAKKFVKIISCVFFPYKIIGEIDAMPKDDGVILCANHISYLDAVFLGLAFDREIRFVGKKVYAEAPILKSLFKWLGAFGIDPDRPDITALKKCFSVIKNKEILGIFPEGTRIIKNRVSDPMPGAIMIAHKTKAPVFYLRIKPKYGKFKLFCKTELYVGGLINVSELGVTDGKGDEYKSASCKLLENIYKLGE